MIAETHGRKSTVALSTKVEEDFIQPLAAVRSSLEILRDYADLTDAERQRFVGAALRGCMRLEQGIGELSHSVYAAGSRDEETTQRAAPVTPPPTPYADRITIDEARGLIDVDFSGFEFRDAVTVNAFYDAIEDVVRATGRNWYFTVNFADVHVWPEAWIAFAHRGKKINATCSEATVRYGQNGATTSDLDHVASREDAFARVAELRRQNTD